MLPPPITTPDPPSYFPYAENFEEFNNLTCILQGTIGWRKVLEKFVSCFERCRFENTNKKIDLITGPKFGGEGGGQTRFSQKPKFDLFF